MIIFNESIDTNLFPIIADVGPAIIGNEYIPFDLICLRI